MPNFEAEYQAFLETQSQSKAYQAEQDYKAHVADIQAGGSYRTATNPTNPKYGAAIGGTVGMLAPLLAGQPELAPLTGPLGAAAGEAGQQLVEQAVGSLGAPRTGGEAAQRIVEEGAFGLAGTGGGRGGAALARKGLAKAPLAGGITAESWAVENWLLPYSQQPFLPSELAAGYKMDIVQNVAENSILGGGAIREFKKKRFDNMFSNVADKLVEQFGPRMSPADAGRAVVDSIKYGKETEHIPIQMIYNSIEAAAAPTYTPVPIRMTVKRMVEGTVDAEAQPSNLRTEFKDITLGDKLLHLKVMTQQEERITSGARVDLRAMKEEIAGMVDIAKRAGGIEDRAMGNTLLQYVANQPDVVSYPVAKQIRTEIRTLKDALSGAQETKNAPGIGKATAVYAKLTAAIEGGLNEYDPFLSEMWREANFMERAGQLKFNNKLVSSLVRKSLDEGAGKPEAIADNVFKRNNVSTINALKNAVDPISWSRLQSVGMQRVIEKWQSEGAINYKALDEAAFGPSGLGRKEFTAAFGPQATQNMDMFIKGLRMAAEKESAPGTMLVQMKQAGAVLLTAGAVGGAVGIGSDSPESGYGAATMVMVTPWMMGKILTNPTAAKWLTRGLSTPAGTAEAAQLAGQLLSFAFPRPSTTARAQAATPSAAPQRPFPMEH